MIARALVLASAVGLGILAATTGSVLLLSGSGPEVLRGVAIGGGLGAAGVALEAGLLVRVLSMARGQALTIVTAGFVVRLAILACGALLLKSGSFADPSAFAMSFVGGFFAGIPVVAVVASGFRKPPRTVSP